MNPNGLQNFSVVLKKTNCIFSKGYEFNGNIDLELLKKAFYTIIQEIGPFKQNISGDSHNFCEWKWEPIDEKQNQNQKDKLQNSFQIKNIKNLEEELSNHHDGSYQILKNSLPFKMIVFQGYKKDHFTILTCMKHEYIDSKSANSIFNLIINLYNSLKENNIESQKKLIQKATSYQILEFGEIRKQNKYYSVGFWRKFLNIITLIQQRPKDTLKLNTPIEDIQNCVEQYNSRNIGENNFLKFLKLPFSDIIKNVRKSCPELTKNNILCSFIVLAIYQSKKDLVFSDSDEKHHVYWGEFVNVLGNIQETNLIGNHQNMVTIKFDCKNKSLIDLALELQYINQLPMTGIQMFDSILAYRQGIEYMKNSGMACSFCISNWNNYEFTNRNQFLRGASAVQTHNGNSITMDPNEDINFFFGSPLVTIHLDPQDQVSFHISQFYENNVILIYEALKNLHINLKI